ncbi:aminoglycoside phosphotransferase [Sphingomonas sp. Leaf34]|nr:phosphotransferase [Sphingomonas sp. Leaf38]KQN30345.1 aminoglycoside phosphotransferase [Sphingomonas sp. Leaf34]KQN32775.1 aminoglycoside phosphotransferase [Sphingomonas sp. Leaf38]
MGTAMEAPTWPAITAEEAAAVIARFPSAGRMTGQHWHSPRPFSAATLVHTTQGAFLLKRHSRGVRTTEGLAEEHAFIAHLAGAGLAVPEVMVTADGATAVASVAWSYELHRAAPGADLYRDSLSWTPFASHAHAHAAGVALATLHEAARSFSAPARRAQPLVASFTILPAADPVAAAETYVAARPALAAFLAPRPWRRELARLFAALGQGLAPLLAGQVSLWTHNDWHPSNLLWGRDGRVETVFDFGLADRTCAVHDIATAIERTALHWLDLGQGTDDIADPDAALALLAGYATVVPLDGEDIAAIIRLLPLVHIEFALSEIDYFTAVVEDEDSAALAWDGYLIGHAAWFLSDPGQGLIRAIEAGAASR